MKLKVNLATGNVTRIAGEFRDLPGVKSNGQHEQLPGHVLVDVRLSCGGGHFNLLDPGTHSSTGHFDVSVRYSEPGKPPTFHYYSANEQFVPAERDERQWFVWTSNAWLLIHTVVAIEEFLEKEVGFQPTLRAAIFNGLHKDALVPA